MIKLTALEINTLQKLKKKEKKWLARDKKGYLYAFRLIPEKRHTCWYKDNSGLVETNHNLFKFIQWEDAEPTSIDALLESNLIKSQDVNEQRQFDTGFVRDSSDGKGRMDLLPWSAIIELSKHCQRGAEHYGERNIDKGAPISCLLDSGLRHLAKYMEGYLDEDHLLAALWNIAWAVQFEVAKKELQDIPNRGKRNE